MVIAAAALGFVFALGGCAASATGPASLPGAHLPACASKLPVAPVKPSGDTQVPVPGDPVGAVLCRYAGTGEQQPLGALVGTAKETTPVQVAQLQRAMNASKALHGTEMGCFASTGDTAIVIIVYPPGTPTRTITYVPDCQALNEGSTEYQVSLSFAQLLAKQTGNW